MGYASSARAPCSASRAASEYTATARTPSSWQACAMRTAISPRLAISTSWNMLALLRVLRRVRARSLDAPLGRHHAVRAFAHAYRSHHRVASRVDHLELVGGTTYYVEA